MKIGGMNGNKSSGWCDHDAEHITRHARENNAIIESAKAGYQNPAQLTTPPLAHKAAMERRDILNSAQDFSAPSPRQSFRACSDEEAAALDEIASNPAESPDPDTVARFDAVMAKLTAHLAMPR